MAWFVTVREVVAMLAAVPPLRDTGLPKLAPSIWNCTVPVGVPVVEALMVAVKVTFWPNTDALSEE